MSALRARRTPVTSKPFGLKEQGGNKVGGPPFVSLRRGKKSPDYIRGMSAISALSDTSPSVMSGCRRRRRRGMNPRVKSGGQDIRPGNWAVGNLGK